ncbi:MAG: CHAD domain-containing protein, partial [Anaerolineae bacterium]
QALPRLGEYTISGEDRRRVLDTYLDTAERRIWQAGYAFRRRKWGEGVLLTLKALKGGENALRHRQELQIQLLRDVPPQYWPTSDIRDRLLEITDGAPLVPLFQVEQTRTVRVLNEGQRSIAELSFDEVHFKEKGKKKEILFIVEAELTGGAEDDLRSVIAQIEAEWGLKPYPQSKFEHGLDYFEIDMPEMKPSLLTAGERATLRHIALHESIYGRRATILLALDEGLTQVEAGRRANMSTHRVRHWLTDFRKRRLGIFPERILKITPPPRNAITNEKLLLRLSATTEGEVMSEDTLLLERPGVRAGDTVAEAARKIYAYHFQRVLFHEQGARIGEDIEALHDMRVATRRLRTATRVFHNHLDRKTLDPFFEEIKRTGRILGTVRDLDVFWEKTQHYLDTHPERARPDLSPLQAAWETARSEARRRMITHLDSKNYVRFKEHFIDQLQRPWVEPAPPFTKKGNAVPRHVRHVAPVLIQKRLAKFLAFEGWLGGEEVPNTRYHRLRIAGKRLRYTLEYFQEVLKPEAEEIIEELKALQDHLGALQDAVVATGLLKEFLTTGVWASVPTASYANEGQPVTSPDVAAYLEARKAEIAQLRVTFSEIWGSFRDPDFRRRVAAIIATS